MAEQQDHVRYFQIAGVTVQVESELPFGERTFDKRFESFQVDGPGPDTIVIQHHFGGPVPETAEPWQMVYRSQPWTIYRAGQEWVYEGIGAGEGYEPPFMTAIFNAEHTRGVIYHDRGIVPMWKRGGLTALTLMPSDQVILARVLADREACLVHSGGLKIGSDGLLFVGHSESGKSTTMDLARRELGERAEILCDDRNIVRLWPDGFRVHGTWSHGWLPYVSSASAPLRAILFLEQDSRNEILPMKELKESWPRLLATLIKPLVTADWWHKEIDVLERLLAEVPCYTMHFDRSGAIMTEVESLLR